MLALPLTRWHQAVSSVANSEKIEMSGVRLRKPGSAAECSDAPRRGLAECEREPLAARRGGARALDRRTGRDPIGGRRAPASALRPIARARGTGNAASCSMVG